MSPPPLSIIRSSESNNILFEGKCKGESRNLTSIEGKINQSVILQPEHLSSISNRNTSFHHSQLGLTSTSFLARGNTVFSCTNAAFKPHKQLCNGENRQGIDNMTVPIINTNTGTLQCCDNEQNKSSLIATIGIKNISYTLSNDSPMSNPHQNPPRAVQINKPSNQQTHLDALKTPNTVSYRHRESNQNFSHQHRRRPVYQRGNTDPQFMENNDSASQRQDKKNSCHPAVPIACSSVGSSANATSPVLTYSHKQVTESVGLSSPLKNVPTATTTIRPSSCVYLRPEQNIPDVFVASRRSTTFKPIVEASKVENNKGEIRRESHLEENINSHHIQNSSFNVHGAKNKSCAKLELPNNNNDASISRDDIVVTMRSVNV